MLVGGKQYYRLYYHMCSTVVSSCFHGSRSLIHGSFPSQVQVKKSKAFRRFKKLQESRPEFNQQKLEDLLLLPLQRIQQ